MQAYCKLCRYFFRRFARQMRYLTLSLAVLELMFLLVIGSQSPNAYEPYEQVLTASQWIPLFLFALFLLIFLMLQGFWQDFTGNSRAIYTLLTLPAPPWALPLAWCTTFLAATCLLVGVQLVLTFASYPLYLLLQHAACTALHSQLLSRAHLTEWNFPPMNIQKGLSYAFLRSNFLRALLPLNLYETPLWLARLLFPAAFCTAILRAKGRAYGVVLPLAAVIIFLHILCLQTVPSLIFSGITLLLECFLLFYTIFLFRRVHTRPDKEV